MQIEEQVRAHIAPLLKNLSIDLWDVESNGSKLRILVDTVQGIDLETLSFVSRTLSSELDNFSPVSGDYTLEVSSPGLDRGLRHIEHYESSKGSEISLQLNSPIEGEILEGETRVMGTLLSVAQDEIEVQLVTAKNHGHPDTLKIPLSEIKKAQVIFNWDRSGAKKENGARAQKQAKTQEERGALNG